MPKLKLSDLLGHPKRLEFDKGYIDVYPLSIDDMPLFFDLKKNKDEIAIRTLMKSFPELDRKEIEKAYQKMHWQYKMRLHNMILVVNKLIGESADKKKEGRTPKNKSQKT